MQPKIYTQAVLTIIALLLGIIALRPALGPLTVQAQSESPGIYVEPGTTLLRKPDGTGQMQGKVFIDLRTGDIWGFPTLLDTPYPVEPAKAEPPTSQPMYLGKFDLSKMKRGQ